MHNNWYIIGFLLFWVLFVYNSVLIFATSRLAVLQRAPRMWECGGLIVCPPPPSSSPSRFADLGGIQLSEIGEALPFIASDVGVSTRTVPSLPLNP